MKDKFVSVVNIIDVSCGFGEVHPAPFEDSVLVPYKGIEVERGRTIGAGFVTAVCAELSADEFEGRGGTVERHHGKEMSFLIIAIRYEAVL